MKRSTATKREARVTPFDFSEILDSEEMIKGYLDLCLEDPDPDIFLMALEHVAKARGVAGFGKRTGPSQENLQKSLNDGRKPQFETVLKIIHAMGMKLSVEQAKPERDATPPFRYRRKREPAAVCPENAERKKAAHA